MVAWQQVKGPVKRILPLVLVAQSLEHLTSITAVMGSIPLWNSEKIFFRGFFIHCQENITNVDIDKANKEALVGAEDNLLTTHVVTKLHLLYKHCPSLSGTKCRMYWNWEGTVQIQSLHCVWRFPVSCFDLICFNLFFVTLKFSHFICCPRVSFLKGSCLGLRI